MKRKCLAVGIILLFIGVAVAPSINFTVVKASNDTDLVEVTTQACGIKGFGDTTVKLTREQYQNLEQYLVEFRARLNQTTTREEVVPLFKDTVVELNKYGLLPKGMSVEVAQRLITNKYQNKRETNNLGLMNRYLQNSNIDNSFCLIAGTAHEVGFVRVLFNSVCATIFRLYEILYDHFEFISKLTLLNYLYQVLFNSYIAVILLKTLYGFINLGIGIYLSSDSGNINTIGLSGEKSWSGSIHGGFDKFPKIPYNYVLGVIGFTGFHITFIVPIANFAFSDFIGFALAVDLDY
jgi:hypothetical protein